MNQKHLIEKRKIWRQLVDQYKDSGKSKIQFCSENNVKPHQLAYYDLKFKKETRTKSKFTKITSDPAASKPIKKQEQNQLPDPKWLATFLKELHARS